MDYRLFKASYTDSKTKQQRTAARWYVEFRDHNRIRHRWPALKEERKSHAFAQRIISLVESRRDGTALSPDVQRWIESADAKLRKKLTEIDLLDPVHVSKGEPLLSHLEGKSNVAGEIIVPGFKQHLIAHGDTIDHVNLTVNRVKKLFTECGFIGWKDLNAAGSVTKVEAYLGEQRKKKTISGQTANYYARAMRSFCHWMVDTGRATATPMQKLKGVRDAEVDKVESRPLSSTEMRFLLAHVANGSDAYGMTREDRALLYQFSFETGIRPGQIRQLTVASFNLDIDPPTVTAKAATVKRKKQHTQVLRPAMAGLLRKALENKMPQAIAFPTMPDKFTCAEMLRGDMSDARAAWLKDAENTPREHQRRLRSDFLATVDHLGRRVNFYSLRHTHGTELGSAGVPQKDIQASLHHTRSSTTDRYVHSDIVAKARAISLLPDIAPQVASATGTEGPLNPRLAKTWPTGRSLANSGAMKNRDPESESRLSSERDGARTRNHRIDRPADVSKIHGKIRGLLKSS